MPRLMPSDVDLMKIVLRKDKSVASEKVKAKVASASEECYEGGHNEPELQT